MDNYTKRKSRPLKTICIHRHRYGDREVINKLKKSWQDHIITGNYYKHDTWYKLLQSFPFIICAHGGGLDPCPKMWEALCIGCIPIVKEFPSMNEIFKEFPVVVVKNWNPETISLTNMEKWIENLAEYYDNLELRNLLLIIHSRTFEISIGSKNNPIC